ncbi:hypothetical protein V6N12_008468 [Hibiscus sabdariffa]|uniref:Uncharacterized protein n=1 Tax=Hibiscus sabdariffa TaxID=183260 RepID=A0ABR2BIX9_9ROSI
MILTKAVLNQDSMEDSTGMFNTAGIDSDDRKQRISCVHTQIIEASNKYSGAVNAVIYYKGMLFSGYSDGSIKVWDIKRQSATLVWDVKDHEDTVTCFSLFEPGETLLSGSTDKTIRVTGFTVQVPRLKVLTLGVLGSQVSALLTLVTIIDFPMDTDGPYGSNLKLSTYLLM